MDMEEVKQAITQSPDNSTVYIGSDSKVYSRHGKPWVAYVTVVILHHGSSHGARIFREHRTEPYYGQMKARLLTEVSDAVTIGLGIMDVIGDRNFEIHLDINRNPKYKSSEIIREASGYVMGTFGFEPKLKPDSFAASSVADRFCVKDARRKKDSPAQKRKYARFMNKA